MFIGIEGFGSRCKRLGAFARVYDTRGMHPVARIFILGFFAQNVIFGRTDFFQHSPHLKAPPEFFSYFKTQRFATSLILRVLRKFFVGQWCAGHGRHAEFFSDPAVQWWLVAVCVKSVQTYKYR